MKKSHFSARAAWVLLLLFLPLSIFLGLAVGSTPQNLFAALQGLFSGEAYGPETRIFLYVRLPRVLASLLCGSALAVSGVLLQAVLGNPLASPNTIGVNAGAGLCVFLSLALFPALPAVTPFAAFLGALAATLLIYAVASRAGAGKLTLILAGMAISSVFTAGINTIKTFFPDTLYNGSSFLIGGLSGVAMTHLSPAFLLILVGLAAAFLFSPQLDILSLGEETAHSLGMNVRQIRFTFIILACLLAGAAVSFAGLLSFVGLIVPHITRRIFGASHRLLIPASCLLGGIFVTLCDLLSRLLFAPYEVPVGIILAFLGGPFFLFLILRQRRKRP